MSLLGMTSSIALLLVSAPGPDEAPKAPPELSVRASENAALDTIIANRPLSAPPESLLALTAPNPNHMQFQYWLDHVIIAVEPDGSFHIERWMIARVAREEGALNLASEVGHFVEGLEKPPVLRARVVCPDSPPRVFDPLPLTVSKPVERARAFTAELDAAGRIEGVAVGCAVETHWTYKRKAAWLDGPFDAGAFVFQEGRIEQRLTVSAPPNTPLVAATLRPDGTLTEVTAYTHPDGSRTVSHVRRRRTRPALSEELQPIFFWQIGNRSWSELSTACARRMAPVVGAPVPPALLPRPTKGPTPLHTIRRVAAAVRARLEREPAAWKDQAFALPTPSAILKRRTASPVDAAVVLAAALRREGFPAHVGFIVGRLGPSRPDLERPSTAAFSRPVVYVPPSGDAQAVWIDASNLDLPAGALDGSSFGTHAFLCGEVPGASETLLALPVRADQSSVAHIRRRVSVDPVSDIRVEAEVHYDGPIADALRRYVHSGDPAAIRQEFDWLPERGFGGEVVSATIIRDDGVGPVSARVVVEGGEVAAYWRSMELPSAYFDAWLHVPNELDPNLTEKAEGGEFGFPQAVSSETIVEVPVGFEPTGPLPSLDLQLGPARWRYASTYLPATPGTRPTVTTTASLDFGPRRWSTADVEAFRTALSAYRRGTSADIVLSHAAFEALSQSDAGVGSRLFQALLLEHPKDPAVPAMLSFAWLSRGVTTLSRMALEAAFELDPKHPMAHYVAAHALQDWAVRTDPSGKDTREAVVGAWRKAHALAPRRRDVELEMAVALTGIDLPWQLWPDAERNEGVGRLRTMARVDGVEAAVEPYLRVLWNQRPAAEVLAESKDFELSGLGLTVKLAALAVVEGPEAFRRALVQQAARGETQQALVQQAFQTQVLLMMTGKWNALSRLASGSTEIRMLADALGDTPLSDAGAVDRRDPGSVAIAWSLATSGAPSLSPTGAREAILQLTHKDYADYAAGVLVERALERRSAGPLETAPVGATIRGMRQAQRLSVEGRPGIGARVVSALPADQVEMYLAPKEAGSEEWAVLPSLPRAAALYDRAVTLWAAGDEKAAEQWFAWAEAWRTRLDPKSEMPVVATDLATKRAKAARFALEVLPGPAAVAEARRTLANDDAEGWDALGTSLMLAGDDAGALEAFERLPTAVAEKATWAVVARIRTLKPAEARAWVDARLGAWPPSFRVASVVRSVSAYVDDDAWLARLIDARVAAGEPRAGVLAAWAHHLEGRVTEESEKLAREAVDAGWEALKNAAVGADATGTWAALRERRLVYPGRRLRADLHTLACVLLDLGKVEEGVKVALDARPEDGAEGPWDRYLAARVAEASGFTKEADRIDRELLANNPTALLKQAIEVRRARKP